MHIVFAGTPDFAARSLAALIEAGPAGGWSIPLVLTQPDRPAGRGMKLTPSPVKQLAQQHGLNVDTPVSLRKGPDAAAAQQRIAGMDPDVLVVAAYGLILPQAVLDIPRGLRSDWNPRLTAVNVHASMLPRWRGAAPVARAIEAGDASTGVTIMQMDAGLDTGPILLSQALAIGDEETTALLTDRLADLGARLLVQGLSSVVTLVAQPQPTSGFSYASKIDKAEAWLDWTSSAEVLARKVRAYDPFPVAQTQIGELQVRVWRACAVPTSTQAEPGTIVRADAAGIDVACGQGCLRLLEVQRAGARRLSARDFLAGHRLSPSQRFAGGPAHA